MAITFDSSSPIQALSDTTVRIPEEDRTTLGLGFAQANATLESLFSVLLYDIEQNGTLDVPALDPAGRTTAAEYFFRTPPKVSEIHEPFSTQITPTQGGGRFIESNGSLIKEIRIQGTTGFRPSATARARPATAPGQTPANISEITGHDDLIFLKNIFRAYSDIKRDLVLSSKTVMLWRSVRDGEYWVVEPSDFRTSQNSQSPLTFDYDFNLKTISKLSLAYALNVDPLIVAHAPRGFQNRLNNFCRDITNVFAKLTGYVNQLRKYGVDAVNTVIRPLTSLLNGLSSLRNAGQRLVNFVAADVVNVAINLFDAYVRVFTVSSAQDPQNILANTLKRASQLAANIANEPVFRKSVTSYLQNRVNRYADAYNTSGSPLFPIQGPRVGSSQSFIGNQPRSSSVRQDYVRVGEDLRACAARLMGSRARWHTLAAINDLRPPYVSAVGGPNLLKPGDVILYPGTTSGQTQANNTNQSTASQEGSSSNINGPVVDAYGRDIRLSSSTTGTSDEVTDFAISQGGDIDTITGIPNVDQAIHIKFATEQGELTVHPKFGALFPIGSKMVPSSFNTFRINTEATLKSDPRIASIDKISFQAQGDVLSLQAKLRLTNGADQLVTAIDL